MTPIKAWYFSEESKKLRYGDDRLITIGVEHTVKGYPDPCHHGLHGCEQVMCALEYAPGPVIWQVELSGRIKKDGDKIAATRRKYIAGGVDISDVLRHFARLQALSVAHLWDMPTVVREYLETGDESERLSARSAAQSSAQSPAWLAAQLAAQSAAWSAVQSSAWSAAWSAAESAAWSAAWSAVQSSAWSDAWLAAQLAAESAIWSAAKSAAQSAAWSDAKSDAWSAAESAAESAANKMLTEMVEAAILGKEGERNE